MNLDGLFEPFPKEAIHWRVGATNGDKTQGIALAYIDARDAMNRLDGVCGAANWQCRYPFAGCCEIGIKIDGEWVWKANGAGETDVEGTKGQFSDAFKRAAVMWGIGQYLYSLPNEWVPIKPAGRSYKLAATPTLPNWALPGVKGRLSKKDTDEYVKQMREHLINADEHGVRELSAELDNDQKLYIWRFFNSAERGTIKEFLK